MRLELFGAITFTTLAAAACGGSDQDSSGTQSASGTGGYVSGVGTGGASAGTAGTPIGNAGNAGTQTGVGGAQTGAGGNQPGAGGNQPGAGGNQPGAGGTGTGGVATVTCPATMPNDGDACTGRGSCPFGGTTCFCARSQNGGTTRAWRCFTAPDGGFQQPGDGGFTPQTCAHASDCAGAVCCQFTQTAACVSSAICTRAGGTPLP
jgi:hypothetical protein